MRTHKLNDHTEFEHAVEEVSTTACNEESAQTRMNQHIDQNTKSLQRSSNNEEDDEDEEEARAKEFYSKQKNQAHNQLKISTNINSPERISVVSLAH